MIREIFHMRVHYYLLRSTQLLNPNYTLVSSLMESAEAKSIAISRPFVHLTINGCAAACILGDRTTLAYPISQNTPDILYLGPYRFILSNGRNCMLFPCAIRKLSYGSNRILIEARIVKSQSSTFGPVAYKSLTDRSMCYIQIIIIVGQVCYLQG